MRDKAAKASSGLEHLNSDLTVLLWFILLCAVNIDLSFDPIVCRHSSCYAAVVECTCAQHCDREFPPLVSVYCDIEGASSRVGACRHYRIDDGATRVTCHVSRVCLKLCNRYLAVRSFNIVL